MNTKTFSQTVLEQFADSTETVITQFAESAKAHEAARKAVRQLTERMAKHEVSLKKHEKDSVRSGRKTLNRDSFKGFVVRYLSRCQGEKHLDDIVKAAREQNVVSVNKAGLRDSIERAVYELASTKGSNVKSHGDGFYSHR